MSGPVTPPLTVSDVDDGGSVTGRPITTIEVTDGTLSISGNIAKVTTGGGGGGGGVTSIATTGPISGGTITTTGTISITQSDTSTDGYLSSTDWNTFNNKGSGTVTSITAAADSGTGTAITSSGTFTFTGGTNVTTSVTGTTVTINSTDQYTGTVTAVSGGTGLSSTGGTTPAISLDNTAVSAGTYGDASNVAQITIDAQGRITSASDVAISGGGGAPTDASYVVLGVDGTLSAERVLTAGTGITLTDAGAGSTLTIDADQGDVTGTGSANNLAYWTGTDTISDSANFSVDAPSGTLDVFSYVEAGSNRIGSGGSKNEVTTSSATDLVLNTYTGTNSGTITITEGVDGAIDIAPNGAGLVKVSNLFASSCICSDTGVLNKSLNVIAKS